MTSHVYGHGGLHYVQVNTDERQTLVCGESKPTNKKRINASGIFGHESGNVGRARLGGQLNMLMP